MQQAIWYIESHLSEALDLDTVARAVGCSRFQLARAFPRSMGMTVMRYVRDRRLTVAALRLAAGEADILNLALDLQYGSHEAFTRAFHERLGLTPTQVRAARSVVRLPIQEAIPMDTAFVELPDPKIIEAPALHLAGLHVLYPDGPGAELPAQWTRFNGMTLPPGLRCGEDAWGVCEMKEGEGLHYTCAIEVAESATPPGVTRIDIPATRYAVFHHAGHISEIRRSWNTIVERWFPSADWAWARGPDLERYTPAFDPVTGAGGVEIWVPVQPR